MGSDNTFNRNNLKNDIRYPADKACFFLRWPAGDKKIKVKPAGNKWYSVAL